MFRPAILSIILLLSTAFSAGAKSLATITVGDGPSDVYSAKLRQALAANFTILDDGLASAAFASFKFRTPMNLTQAEAAAAGLAIGCDAFLIVNAGTIRRSSFKTPVYFESFASVFLVETRTGKLLEWFGPRVEAPTENDSLTALLATTPNVGNSVAEVLNGQKQTIEETPAAIEILPDSPEKGLKPPIPYRRIKPVYTESAETLGIAATVEILVDIGSDGAILRTSVSRWAGFGLDESVEQAVRAMDWRPAYRDGKPIPMRVLLRYNFKRLKG